MFTGLIEETGRVLWLRRRESQGVQLAIEGDRVLHGWKRGDSLAINGCCLTATEKRGSMLYFDLLQETLDRTNLGRLRPDTLVNLERCVTPNTRMGGHFVQGHVDSVAEVLTWEAVGADWKLDIRLLDELAGYVAYKGSIAVNGISLTVSEILPGAFRVWIIPHTREVTNLKTLNLGDQVNLEFDILAKYVERLLQNRGQKPGG